MKLLVFAHKPPPHHGQSYMVQLLIEALGGDQRRTKPDAPERSSGADGGKKPPVECYHVDCRLSEDTQDIGRVRWGKLVRVLSYCLEAIWCRFRYGVTSFYYVL